jgi:NAD(P)-dependent dehydrogenase (short-subunit alcohol dehydrogenase family)
VSVLAGRVAVITGASRGLGRAMALALAAAGADVAVAGRAKPDLEATAHGIEGLGRRALAVPTDVTRYVEVEASSSAPVRSSAGSTFWSTTRAWPG